MSNPTIDFSDLTLDDLFPEAHDRCQVFLSLSDVERHTYFVLSEGWAGTFEQLIFATRELSR